MSDNLNERLTRMEEKVKNHDRRLTGLENNNETLTRLATLMEIQVESNKKQQEQIDKQHQILTEMSSNLVGLNSGLNEVKDRVTNIEKSDSNKKIDLVEFGKDILFKVIPTLIGAWLIFKFGIK